ncbi:type VI secretion system-associated protein TagF [Rhizobium sp. P40RR-XXII]|uniref:type VI secretion system-associated protein TagF n=1 Tax=unclassified Rhizobium TaxID=2613769 RepID=UPI00145687B3|nr:MULTISPECIES: type VI secretion system-associated protein TagF [unclassified Rhizobium]NLR89265.1 type VI secretion system-associated protein TagF [Rhizobium sp. P28RR-XV]NLS20127.1 type VI secretion system-associated protein TagF [Rhizobium sp. P40RR-XXII]
MNDALPRAQSPMQADAIGFFGKLPTHGDFVSSALGLRLQSELDRWIHGGLIALEATLGEEWRRLFHATTAWRFVVGSGIWGPTAVAGVLLPSRDRVGRSFPLIIVAQLQRFSGQLRDLCEDDSWFTAAEALAETSDNADFDMQRFIEGTKRLRSPFADKRSATAQSAAAGEAGPPASLWWRINPGTRHGKGFRTMAAPTAQDFVKLVTAEAIRAPIATEPLVRAAASVPDTPDKEVQVAPATRVDWTIDYSRASHPGTRFSLNADALLVSAPRIFAIADGVGDGLSAIEAARITTGILAGIPERESAQALVQDVKGKLSHAHAILRAKGANSEKEAAVASFVVAIVLDDEFAAIWAGDARCYLLRDGLMRLLTHDHIDIGLRRTLGRGLGLKDQFVAETVSDQLSRGDRLLLVSGPLSRALTDRIIAEILIETPLEQAAEALIQEALIANCRENVSAIVISAQ